VRASGGVDMYDQLLHVNLLRWRNLIGSLCQGNIGQYPMIEILNSGYCFHRMILDLVYFWSVLV
jgi:hypothetical protein